LDDTFNTGEINDRNKISKEGCPYTKGESMWRIGKGKELVRKTIRRTKQNCTVRDLKNQVMMIDGGRGGSINL
jgi:hypothetical protein